MFAHNSNETAGWHLLDNLLEGVQIIDYTWQYVYVNDALLRYSKYTKEELLGFTMQQKYPGIENTNLFRRLNECMKNRVSKSFENEFTFPDGSVSYFQLSVEPCPQGILILSVDISEYIKAKKKLQAAHEKLLFHLENTPLGFIEWDESMQIKAISKRAEEIFGWGINDFLDDNKVAHTIVHEEDQQLIFEKTRALLKGEVERNQLSIRCYTKDAKVIWCEWFNSALRNEQGRVITILSLINDVSDQKKAEEKLIKVNRLYAFLSAINQSLIHVEDVEMLFKNVCEIAVNIGRFKIAWIGLTGDNKHLQSIAVTGDEAMAKAFLEYSAMDFSQPGLINSTIGKVLQTAEYAVNNSVQDEEATRPWKQVYIRNNIKATIALPLKKKTQLIGVMSLSSTVENFFDAEEIALLQEAVSDISFAVETVEVSQKHKAAEALLVNNEKRFRALIEKSRDMKTLSSIEGKILYASPSVTKVLGYTPQESLHNNALQLIHPDDLPEFLEKRSLIMESPGSAFTFQYRIKHKKGNWLWCEGTLTNHLNEPGIHAFVCNYRDISERRRAEQQREFDRNNLNALINSTTDLMWSVGKDLKLITFNQPFKNFIALSTGDEIKPGDDIRLLKVSPERKNRMSIFYERALKGEVFTETLYTDKPVPQWNEISFYPIYKNEEVIGTACYLRDITERKITEQQLKNSEAFNRGVIDSLSAHIAVIDAKGTIVTVNEAWKKFAAENGEPVMEKTGIGANYLDVCRRSIAAGDTVAKEVLGGIENVMKKRVQTFYLEYPCHSSSRQRWFTMRVMRFENNEPLLVIAHEDISMRKLAELQRVQTLNALIARNKDLEQFSYIVSHNLRAPVANIIGASQLIDHPQLSFADKEILVKGVGESAKQLDEVVRDMNYILGIRNIEKEKHEKIYLPQFTKEIISELKNLTENNDVTIDYDFSQAEELITIKSYLRSIFINLITNSIKYRTSGVAAVIKIKAMRAGDAVEFTFTDNGTGIDLINKGKEIFGLYKRFHTGVEGRGIGLFLTKTQTEILEGTITVKSEENKGTTFTVTIPHRL